MILPQPWNLLDFAPRFELWVDQEHPLEDLRVYVLDWIFTRTSDPYADARRYPDSPITGRP